MNFSESTFILPNERPDTDIRMRIFTPFNEMPMAGHPTIGSTFALAHTGVIKQGAKRFVFGLNIGPTPVDLEWADEGLSFGWMTQRPPTFGPIVDAARGGGRRAWSQAGRSLGRAAGAGSVVRRAVSRRPAARSARRSIAR